jgi:hypothetical protein
MSDVTMSDVTERAGIGCSIDNEGAPTGSCDNERAAAILFIGSPPRDCGSTARACATSILPATPE